MADSIGLYYSQVGHGGVARVAALQANKFVRGGYRVILFTDQNATEHEYALDPAVVRVVLPACKVRYERLRETIKVYGIRWFIHHLCYSERLERDMAEVKAAGARVVLCMNEAFPFLMRLSDEKLQDKIALIACADAVVCLSKMDALGWCALGCCSKYIPNPLSFNVADCPVSSPQAKDVVWCGRLSPEKRPDLALRVFAKVVERIPDARLQMIGSGHPRYVRQLAKLSSRLGVADKVAYCGETDAVSAYFQNAWVHLLTSSIESYSMVLAEAKAHRVPTVMFALPYLALVEGDGGCLSAPQEDVDGLADQLWHVLAERGVRDRLGALAYQNLQDFTDERLLEAWRHLLGDLDPCQTGSAVTNQLNTEVVHILVREMVRSHHYFLEQNRGLLQLGTFSALLAPKDVAGRDRLMSGLGSFLSRLVQRYAKMRAPKPLPR